MWFSGLFFSLKTNHETTRTITNTKKLFSLFALSAAETPAIQVAVPNQSGTELQPAKF